VERKYLDAGYLQVELDEPEVDTTEDGLVVTVEIREGKRFRVGKLDVTGDETVDLEALRAELSLEEGEWFNRSHLTRDVENLTHRYTDRGFYYAKVNPITNLSEQDLTVDVDFEVEKGPLYFVREIEISGNARTVDPVIRREMRLVEGQLWSARALDVSQGRIRNLGFFEEVNLEPQPTDYPDQLDLNVKVVERPTGSLSFGAGFSSQDGFVVSGSVAQSNLFGRGYGVQASADLGGDTDRFYLSFANSYLFGSDFSLSTTLFRTDLQFEDFPQQQQGAELTLGHALDEENRSRGFWRYSFADREVDEDTNVNAAGMIFRQILVGSQATSLTGLVLRTDTRDDRVLATEGYQLFAEADLAGLGGFAEFLRLEGRVGWYHRPPDWRWLPLPFRDRSAVHLAARFGWALPFNSISDWDFKEGIASGVCLTADDETCALDQIDTDLELPLTERYFLGGIGTFQLRGFKARSVGPRRALVRRTGLAGTGDFFVPVGRAILEAPSGDLVTVCADVKDSIFNLQGNGNGKCNSLDDKDIDDFDDLDETDVIGGNKFVSLTAEYRFPISEALGLMGILFFDTGNAFAENEDMIDVANWRLGTGAGVLWFSPFGPIQAFLGFPLDPLEVEDTTVFEFSVGGVGL
jgi:outer membrane protein insertion porin family